MSYTVDKVAEYFLWLDAEREGDGVSNMKLQKLVYYAQGFHLAIFGSALFSERIEAWEHGPVVPPLYGKKKHFGMAPIEPDPKFDREVLSSEARELIDEVFDVYGRFSAWKLRQMTHEEKPWIEYEKSGGVIPHAVLASYFKTKLNTESVSSE